MMTTKERERQALAQIRKIVAGLGEDSYIGKAFEGCFEIAEENINNDFWESMKRLYERAQHGMDEYRMKADALALERDQLSAEVDRLTARIEREEEWKPYEGNDGNTPQAKYDELASDASAKELSDDEAAQIIADEFGFERDRIRIVREINTYEINRHGRLRKAGTTPRRPLFDAWDYYYIRFDVIGNARMSWEVYGGDLHLFSD